MNTTEYAVILVYSTSYALRAEKVLEEAGIPCKLIPVPRHLSSDCGSCIRIFQIDKDRALPVLSHAKVEMAGIHDV
ncbi:hypothetical protein U27_05668 [Candidatus Vecturithrix granuli]|uniref:Putative Se/S carrier protein-like domain-containing protein n=1 Tax=Vecturithrix granuli TaxID=1499967 RepID=A0A081C288_VECG1|nr:hypothetical protein U27_05668 [Candidatus Vecturithrix granuli]